MASAAAPPPPSLSSLRRPPSLSYHTFSLSPSLRFASLFSAFHSLSLSISHVHDPPLLPLPRKNPSKTLAVAEGEPVATADVAEEGSEPELQEPGHNDSRPQAASCELYICNIPRSCDISELHALFKPFGTVRSVGVSRNSETGISRGCGYVTMSSISEAKAAIAALDGSDLGGREMRVRFSYDTFSKRKFVGDRNSTPMNVFFESPFKAYVGNLAWSVKPTDLREHFSQFGSVISARVLRDRKEGKGRVYGFVSFGSAEELGAAISSSGTIFCGREMLVREVVARTE